MTVPEWIVPMAATLTQDRCTSPDWIFERKLDGIRLVAIKESDDVRLLSRNKVPQNLPIVAAAIAALPVSEAVFDGELTWNDGLTYHVFDVMWLNEHDVTGLPLYVRQSMLDRIPFETPVVRVHTLDDAEPWTRACEEGWEGVIAKRRDSVYEGKRSRQWLKMKCESQQTFVVGGFTDPRGVRVGLGALLVGYYDGDELLFAGKVGTGLDTGLLMDLRMRLDALEVTESPFTRAKGLPRVRAHWTRPEIVVEVAFIEWTIHGKLRHSRLRGLKPDVHPHDVTRDALAQAP
ncbi:MAG: ATP-dependent DNA ligase [Gemmatimonadaceae bacterium]